MLKFLKNRKTANNDVMVAEQNPNFKGKTTNEIVEEIHESFYTEVDKLLAEAKIAKSLDTDKQHLIDKAERLKTLGFTGTKEVKDAEAEIKRLDALKKENEAKNNLIEAIDYFSFKYPTCKFITEESVKKICEKYGLVYGDVNNYLGIVPNENLKHIENCKISEDDECYADVKYEINGEKNIIVGCIYKRRTIIEESKDEGILNNRSSFSSPILCAAISIPFPRLRDNPKINREPIRRTRTIKCPLEIVAPLSDFNTEDMQLGNFKLSKLTIEVPDPIVLKPVIFKRQKYYLIVTAWGLEAGDELVVNATHN